MHHSAPRDSGNLGSHQLSSALEYHPPMAAESSSSSSHSGQFRAVHLPPSSLSVSTSSSTSTSASTATTTAANTATGSNAGSGPMHPSAGEFPQSLSAMHSALPPAAVPARLFPAQSIYRPDFTQSDRFYPAAASRWGGGGGAWASAEECYDGIAEENEAAWAEDSLDTYIDSLDNPQNGLGLGPGYYYDGPAGAAFNEDAEPEPAAAAATYNWTQIEESCRRMEQQHMRIMEVDLTCIGDGNGGEQVLYEFTFEETDDNDAAAAAAADDDAADGAAAAGPDVATGDGTAAAEEHVVAAKQPGGDNREHYHDHDHDHEPWYFGRESAKAGADGPRSMNPSAGSGNSSGSNSSNSRSGSDGLGGGRLSMDGARGAALADGAADGAGSVSGSASGSPKTVLPAPGRGSVSSGHGRRGGGKSSSGGGSNNGKSSSSGGSASGTYQASLLSGLFRNIKRRCSAVLFSPSSSFSSSSSTSSAAAAAAAAGVMGGSVAPAVPAASRLSSEAKAVQGSIKQRVFGAAGGRWRRSKGPRLQRCNSLS
ncbi:hypothetical protein CLOM_g16734 [Closterium sp. NIES-68]|nr:hypothetical protein CLOM_g16734 [Closterium sp. NIES-68]GJP67511.1 hypothetical protein CLOP_g24325 [Closterium sp. NIES-67]